MENTREYIPLLSLPSVFPKVLPAPLNLNLRGALLGIFGDGKVKKKYNFGSLRPVEIPSNWELYDLQSILLNGGFYPLATEEICEAEESVEVGNFYGNVGFVAPLEFYEPNLRDRNSFGNIAVSIAASPDERLTLVFGSLVYVQSGWRIINNDHPLSDQDNLIKPAPVTYFKFQ